MSHLLINRAFVYSLPKTQPDMEGYIYDQEKGYWLVEGSDNPAVLEPNFVKPRSKKADIETGEDRKGE